MEKNSLRALEEAEEYWHAGRTFQAGELIFEATAKRDRPKWAARILRLVLERSDADRSDFEQVLSVADDPTQWSHGRLAFRELCDAGLRFQKTYDRPLLARRTHQRSGVQRSPGIGGGRCANHL